MNDHRKEGHSALRVNNGKIEKFDPHHAESPVPQPEPPSDMTGNPTFWQEGEPSGQSPHPSGINHGCPYDYSNPDTDKLLCEEKEIRHEVSGTFSCPICSKSCVHEHTSEQVVHYKVANHQPLKAMGGVAPSKECRNPNHALVDGKPFPHDIGPSCMAAQLEQSRTHVMSDAVVHYEKYTENKPCCTVCDGKKLCHVCGAPTLLACSDCAINFGATVYVCCKAECREEHDRKCFGDGRTR